jgi:isoamylase
MRADDEKPTRTIELDPSCHRTGDVWHVWIQGVHPGQLYACRADGPYLPKQGHCVNKHKLLLDPYAKAITGRKHWNFSPALGYNPTSPQGDLSLRALRRSHLCCRSHPTVAAGA